MFGKSKNKNEEEDVIKKMSETKPLTTGYGEGDEIKTSSFIQKIYEVLESIDVKKYWKSILVSSILYIGLFVVLTFMFFGVIYQAIIVGGEPTFGTGLEYGIIIAIIVYFYAYKKGWENRDKLLIWVDINGAKKIPIKIVDVGEQTGLIKFIPIKATPFYNVEPKDLINPNRALTIAIEDVACKLSNDVLVSASVIERDGIMASYYAKVDFRYIPDEDKTRFVRQIDELTIEKTALERKINTLSTIIDDLYALIRSFKIKDVDTYISPILGAYTKLKEVSRDEARELVEQVVRQNPNQNEEEEF